MADQVGSSTMAGHAGTGSPLSPATAGGAAVVPHEGAHHRGRPVSWVAVSIIMAGFLAGGLGLILGPAWWLFWVGAGLAVVGAFLALATDIFQDWY
ncbi:MAG TPA: hypothetical protein VGS19_27760 [Streptosporangiaceae bacterium]|nr:hypothetical protein [Streptosporangiaceae bacterium]